VCSDSTCGAEHFPRTDPCVLMLVCDGERCLLGRSRGWPNGMHSALAGFVEPGETLEQAVAREVMEEVGVELGAVRYVSSQPWPFPASLMIGFVAEARTTDIRIDEHELEAARWVTREQLRDPRAHGFFVPPPAALAGQLIAAFTAGTLIDPSKTSP
jgi:NAD+ diphosphatase